MASSARRRSTVAVVFRFAAAEAILLFFCWWIFQGSWTIGEGIVGGVSIVISVAVCTAAYLIGVARFRPRLWWIGELWRVPWLVCSGFYSIAAAFVRHDILRGPDRSRMIAMPFGAGATTGRGEARRALTVVFTTLAPNFIILDIDRERNLMLVHQVSPSGVPQLTKNLSADTRRRSGRRSS